MNFGMQIRNIRTERGLTQEQFAEKLNVTRQAISNWENNRNLPDIEMLLAIADTFHISLDDLISGGGNMNNMAEKLIQDGSDNRRARCDLIATCAGAGMILIGAVLVILKGLSVDYIDASGVLHENFFLLPVAAVFILAGFITVLVAGIRNLISIRTRGVMNKRNKAILITSAVITLMIVVAFVLLIISNGSVAQSSMISAL